MKICLRSLLVIFTLVFFSGLEAETSRSEHLFVVEHPVLTSGEDSSLISGPEIDLSSFHHVEKTQLAKLRVNILPELKKTGVEQIVDGAHSGYDLPKSYHHPVPIGMKLIFPEHYFW